MKKDMMHDPEEMGETESMHEAEGPDDHEVEMAAHHMMKAEEIKNNPKLFPHVQKHLAKKMKAMKKITSISQLRDIAKEKMKA